MVMISMRVLLLFYDFDTEIGKNVSFYLFSMDLLLQ